MCVEIEILDLSLVFVFTMVKLTFWLLKNVFQKNIPIHVSKGVPDTTKLHLINQALHKELGPVYMEKLGPDVNAMWIADPK